jgi:hypothetical protein
VVEILSFEWRYSRQWPTSYFDPTMSATYTIYCITEGENRVFVAQIGSNESIGILKIVIRTGRFETLPENLELYQVDFPENSDLEKNVSHKMLENPTELKSTTKLAEIYPSGPPEKTIHIVVRVPSSKCLTEFATAQCSSQPLYLEPLT